VREIDYSEFVATHRLSGIGNHAGDDALKAVQVELIKANLKLKQLRQWVSKLSALR
jgi:hypothetical protein